MRDDAFYEAELGVPRGTLARNRERLQLWRRERASKDSRRARAWRRGLLNMHGGHLDAARRPVWATALLRAAAL